MNCRSDKFSSTLMGFSCLRLSIEWSLFYCFMVVSCFSFLHPRFSTIVAASKLGGNDTDQLALLAFKANIIDDPFQVMTSWNESIHFCEWHGITCGRRHQRVIKLDLQSQKLFGSMSPHIGNLSFLRKLYLHNNSFVHEIPPQLGRLARLQILALHNNSLNGKIPANLSGCSNLLGFDFDHNTLAGAIPTELGSLSKLQRIFISQNDLTGDIPHSFANLTSLEALSAFGNNFGGSIPDGVGQLTNLTTIALAGNRLFGTIPPSIFNLSYLEGFDVGDNKHIHGSLPSDIGFTLPNLKFLLISDNQFTGSLPNSIANASNLEVFTIDLNSFEGKVPTMEKLHNIRFVNFGANSLGSGGLADLDFLSSLINATHLQVLALDHNNFGGTLPESIGNLSTKLEVFIVGSNYIVGKIPAGIGNLINLNILNMWANQLTGNIPTEIGKLEKLHVWDFSINKLTGFIPFSVGNLSLLTNVRLNENNFQGSIPSSMGKSQNLLLLDFSNNNLSGTIPHQVIGLSSLSVYLNLSQNHLSGSLPMEVGNLRNLGIMDISENMLSGEIPITIGSCESLEILNMQGNSFQGPLPSSLSLLRGLQELDFSRNNLSSKIPQYLASFQLKKLNLSFNDFDGEVPMKGIFKNASATSVMGNNKLCGGVPELRLPRCKVKELKKSRPTFIVKLVVSLSCGFLGVILALSFIYLYWFRKSRKAISSSLPDNSLFKVSYQSLLKATSGFSLENIIGVGSFGSVYKGFLNDEDGNESVVAVKVLNLSHQGASKSFLSECKALRNIRHRNLVKVVTACSGVDYQGNDFKALVYEFMVNGNLDEWLHQIQDEYEPSEQPKNLSLLERLNIGLDVACALDYLHHHCHAPIIHCDLKPSNILLNNDMIAHVGDFGLARFLVNASCSNSAQQTSSSIGVRGSIGYVAPGKYAFFVFSLLFKTYNKFLPPKMCAPLIIRG
ncbi:unnamed protein product [Ilex paraguariensis]|uniref:non-specific serine/threonine protein kinase n=1 Tax=Ilex paraguariensis TaxID=185542 RepID=A0ABC8R5M2_9AQUA